MNPALAATSARQRVVLKARAADDDEVDRRLLTRFIILLLIVALLALLLTGWSIWGRVKPWTELPNSAVLVTAVDQPIDVAV